MGVWIFTVIVFTLTVTVVKHAPNISKSGIVIGDEHPKLRLLTMREMAITSDSTLSELSPTNDYSITFVKGAPNSQLEESASTSSDIPKDTQPANVEIALNRPLQIDAPRLEESNSLPYVITTGAFSQYHNAEKQQLKFSRKGYQAWIFPAISSSNQKVHVVSIFGFPTISAAEVIANKMKQELEECGGCFIATVEKPNYRVGRGRQSG